MLLIFPFLPNTLFLRKPLNLDVCRGYRNGTLGSLLKVSGSVKIFEILHSMMIWEDSDFQQFYRQNHQKFIFKCNISHALPRKK